MFLRDQLKLLLLIAKAACEAISPYVISVAIAAVLTLLIAAVLYE